MYPLISVIVPIYKVEAYLNKCVDSILGQTYQNLEVILVDDGSPDNCGEICDEYAAKDMRVKVIHKPNGGLSDARNAGMEVMRGQYVSFVDSDDWIEPNHIESLYYVACEDEAVIAVSDISRISSDESILRIFSYSENTPLIRQDTFGYAWNKLYPVNFVKPFRFVNAICEDMLFNLDLCTESVSYRFTKQATYRYLYRENSILTSLVTCEKVNSLLVFSDCIWQRVCKLYSSAQERKAIYTYIVGNHICNFLCILAMDKKRRLTERVVLAKRLMNGIYPDNINWQYADNNLMRLLVASVHIQSPIMFFAGYKVGLRLNRIRKEGRSI